MIKKAAVETRCTPWADRRIPPWQSAAPEHASCGEDSYCTRDGYLRSGSKTAGWYFRGLLALVNVSIRRSSKLRITPCPAELILKPEFSRPMPDVFPVEILVGRNDSLDIGKLAVRSRQLHPLELGQN